jgi:hypothetical protein
MKFFKMLIPSAILKKINDLGLQIKNFKLLAVDYGQFKSIKKGLPVDSGGKELPWYTYPAIEFLSQLDFSEKSVFEYGSGNSSIFWTKRAKDVVSIEDDKEWHESICKKLLKNQNIFLLQSRDEYVNFIEKINKKFDIIIVDAKYRLDCAKKSINFLKDGGIIILDNSDWYPDVAKYIKEKGLIQVDFAGFGPLIGFTWVTSIFFSRSYDFKPINNKQPHYCIGGIEQYAERQD